MSGVLIDYAELERLSGLTQQQQTLEQAGCTRYKAELVSVDPLAKLEAEIADLRRLLKELQAKLEPTATLRSQHEPEPEAEHPVYRAIRRGEWHSANKRLGLR